MDADLVVHLVEHVMNVSILALSQKEICRLFSSKYAFFALEREKQKVTS
jgi:hypothetical protein